MNSTSSSSGVVEIYVTFNIGADVDKAALNVNNRVKQAEPRLPRGGAPPGRVRREGLLGLPAGARVLFARRPLRRLLHLELRDAQRARCAQARARHHERADLRREGLRDAHLGSPGPPRAAEARALATSIRALGEQNAQFAAGKVGEPPTGGGQEVVYNVTTKGRLSDPKEFENIILRANPDGSRLRPEGRRPRRARLEGLLVHRQGERQAGHARGRLPAAGRQRARRGGHREGDGGFGRESASRRASRTPCPTTRRDSWRCPSARW